MRRAGSENVVVQRRGSKILVHSTSKSCASIRSTTAFVRCGNNFESSGAQDSFESNAGRIRTAVGVMLRSGKSRTIAFHSADDSKTRRPRNRGRFFASAVAVFFFVVTVVCVRWMLASSSIVFTNRIHNYSSSSASKHKLSCPSEAPITQDVRAYVAGKTLYVFSEDRVRHRHTEKFIQTLKRTYPSAKRCALAADGTRLACDQAAGIEDVVVFTREPLVRCYENAYHQLAQEDFLKHVDLSRDPKLEKRAREFANRNVSSEQPYALFADVVRYSLKHEHAEVTRWFVDDGLRIPHLLPNRNANVWIHDTIDAEGVLYARAKADGRLEAFLGPDLFSIVSTLAPLVRMATKNISFDPKKDPYLVVCHALKDRKDAATDFVHSTNLSKRPFVVHDSVTPELFEELALSSGLDPDIVWGSSGSSRRKRLASLILSSVVDVLIALEVGAEAFLSLEDDVYTTMTDPSRLRSAVDDVFSLLTRDTFFLEWQVGKIGVCWEQNVATSFYSSNLIRSAGGLCNHGSFFTTSGRLTVLRKSFPYVKPSDTIVQASTRQGEIKSYNAYPILVRQFDDVYVSSLGNRPKNRQNFAPTGLSSKGYVRDPHRPVNATALFRADPTVLPVLCDALRASYACWGRSRPPSAACRGELAEPRLASYLENWMYIMDHGKHFDKDPDTLNVWP